MLRHNFCRPDGRLVKLFLFSTLLDKSPLTSIYFAIFEKKTEVRSPLPTQSKFLVFVYDTVKCPNLATFKQFFLCTESYAAYIRLIVHRSEH